MRGYDVVVRKDLVETYDAPGHDAEESNRFALVAHPRRAGRGASSDLPLLCLSLSGVSSVVLPVQQVHEALGAPPDLRPGVDPRRLLPLVAPRPDRSGPVEK